MCKCFSSTFWWSRDRAIWRMVEVWNCSTRFESAKMAKEALDSVATKSFHQIDFKFNMAPFSSAALRASRWRNKQDPEEDTGFRSQLIMLGHRWFCYTEEFVLPQLVKFFPARSQPLAFPMQDSSSQCFSSAEHFPLPHPAEFLGVGGARVPGDCQRRGGWRPTWAGLECRRGRRQQARIPTWTRTWQFNI